MMRLPNTVSEITPEWVSHALNIQIVPGSFNLEPNADDGFGFLSTMASIKFRKSGSSNDKEMSIIVKLLPDENMESGGARELILTDHFDKAEIYSYQILLPQLVMQLPDLQQFLCQSLYSEIQEGNQPEGIPYSSVLIMNDLKAEGYSMVKFNEDFGCLPNHENLTSPSQQEPRLQYFTQGLDFLAKFHASATSLELQQKKKLPEIFPWISKVLEPATNGTKPPMLQTWFPHSFAHVMEFISEFETSSAEMLQKFSTLGQNASELLQVILIAGKPYATALHGDLWTHNILVNPVTQDIKIIDWQTLCYSDPAFELGIYIVNALHIDYLSKENILEASRLYYAKYQTNCSELKVPSHRTAEEFETYFKTWGLASSFVWLVLGTQSMASIQEYRPKIYRIFELLYNDLNVIDFMLTII